MQIYASNLRKVIFWISSLLLLTPIIVSEPTAYPFIIGKSVWFRTILSFLVLFWGYLCIIDKSFYIKKNFPLLIFGLLILFQILSSIFGSSLLLSFWGNWWRMSGIIQSIYLFIFSILLFASFKNLNDWVSLAKIIIFGGFIVSFIGFLETFNFYLPNLFNLPFSIFYNDYGTNGITSTIGTSVFLSWYLGLIFIITLAVAAKDIKDQNLSKYIFINYNNLGYFFTLLFSAWCLIFNFSRGTFLSLFISMIFVIILYIFSYPSKKIRIIFFSFFIFLISFFSLFISLIYTNDNSALNLQEAAVTKELLSIANLADPLIKKDLISFVNTTDLKDFKPAYDIDISPSSPDIFVGMNFLEPHINLTDSQLLLNLIDPSFQKNTSLSNISNQLEYDVDRYEFLNDDIFCSDSAIFQRWLLRYDSGWNERCTFFGKLVNKMPGKSINSILEGFHSGSRNAAFRSGMNSFSENPIFGIGTQNFIIAYYKYLDNESMINSTEIMDDPHNSVVKILVENGIAGLLLSSILYLFSLGIFLRNIKVDNNNKHFWILLSSALVFYFTNSLFTISLLTNKIILIFLLSLSFRSFLGFVSSSDNSRLNLTKKLNQAAIFLYSLIAVSLVTFFTIYHIHLYQSSKIISINEGITIYEYRDNINQFMPLSLGPRIEMLKKLNLYFETFMDNDPNEFNKLLKLVDEEYKISAIISPDDYWLNYVTANFYWQAAKYNANLSDKMALIVRKLEFLGPDIYTTTEMQIKLAIISNNRDNFEKYNTIWKSQLITNENMWSKINLFDIFSE